MPHFNTSPMIPASALETFEGYILSALIGHRSLTVADGRQFVWFQGDSDFYNTKSPAILDLNIVDLEHLMELGSAANTPLSTLIVETLRDFDAEDGIFPSWDKIDLVALFKKMREDVTSIGAVQVEDLLFSFVSSHQEAIPYLEMRGTDGGVLITADGIERFTNNASLKTRQKELTASLGAAEADDDYDTSFWTFVNVTNGISAVVSAMAR